MKFKAGDPIVYMKHKSSTHPGPRAANVHPAEHGDAYSYEVDKYWLVTDIHADDTLAVVTRTGKRHQLKQDDPKLRKANLLERIFQRDRFPDLQLIQQEAAHE